MVALVTDPRVFTDLTFSPTDARDAYEKLPPARYQVVEKPNWFAPSKLDLVDSKRKPVFSCCDAGAGERDFVQPRFSKELASLDQTGFQSRMCDGHDAPSFATRKPDIVHYLPVADSASSTRSASRRGVARSAFRITAIGDLKSRRRAGQADFSSDEKAHILEMSQVLVQEQPFRTELTSYLCDGMFVAFFRLEYERKVQ